MEKRKKQRKIDKMVEAREKEEKWTHDQRDDFEPCYGNRCHIVGFHFVSAPLKFEKIQAGSEAPLEVVGQLHAAEYEFRCLELEEEEGWTASKTKEFVYEIQEIQWRELSHLVQIKTIVEKEWEE